MITRISWCYNNGAVYGGSNTGGVVGNSEGTISCCYNAANVYSNGNDVGGIAGKLSGSADQCFNIQRIESSGNNVGGLIGHMTYSSRLTNSYNKGRFIVKAYNNAGYLVGCADSSSVTVENCFSYTYEYLPEVSASENKRIAKTVAAYTSSIPTMKNNYFTDYRYDATGWNTSSYIEGQYFWLYNYEMKDQNSFKGFDFTNIWTMTSDSPTLAYKGSFFYNGIHDHPAVTTFPALGAASYSISADKTSVNFGNVCFGQEMPAAQTVTIRNNGTRKLFLPELSAAHFDITGPSSEELPAGGAATYSIRPRSGLGAGNYIDTVTVKAENRSKSASLNLSLNVEVAKSPITPGISLESWITGTKPNKPVVTGNAGGGTETIEYKPAGAPDENYTTSVPTEPGTYWVRVTIAESATHLGGVAKTEFEIYRLAHWEGSGTQSDPWLIKTPKDLEEAADYYISGYYGTEEKMYGNMLSRIAYKGKYFKLANDIDASNVDIEPLGDGRGFCGDFDGAGHTIYGFKGNRGYDALFTWITKYGYVHDLCVVGKPTTSLTAGIAVNCDGRIERCAFYGNMDTSGLGAGIVGLAENGGFTPYGQLIDCYQVGDVLGSDCGGGLAYSYADLYHCYHLGEVEGCIAYAIAEKVIPSRDMAQNYAAGTNSLTTTDGDIKDVAEKISVEELRDLEHREGITWDFENTWVSGANYPILREFSAQLTYNYGAHPKDTALTPVSIYVTRYVPEKITYDAEAAAGYTFIGWNTKSDGTGDWYQPGEEITVSGDTTLYAQYSRNPATFTVSPTSADLDTQDYGTEFAAKDFTLKNTGALKEKFKVTVSKNLTIVGDSTATVSGGKSKKFTVVPKSGLAIGTYNETVTFALSGETDASKAKTVNVKFTVVKAAPDLGLTITGWTYGDAPNAPVLTGNTGGGSETYEYKLKTAADSKYTTTVPTNAGDYTVRVTVAATKNYKGGTETADFTIAKANHKVTAPKALELTCNGKPQTLVKKGSCSTGTILYSLSKNGTYSKNLPTGTDAGEYTVWYYVNATDNYNATSKKSVKVTISDDRLMGDCNGDKVVDPIDLTIMARHLAGWSGYGAEKYDFSVCDFNFSGKPDSSDYVILARSLAGWSGYAEKYLVPVSQYTFEE
ncbi:MAG: InlB B-repeat-containing protein [Ruminococcus sp.]|nr:InlB B-repeat-containing protein [Ruminococcus sp.]